MRNVFALWVLFCGVCLAESEGPSWLRYPAISPDGEQIAFCYAGDIYLVPASGGRAVALT